MYIYYKMEFGNNEIWRAINGYLNYDISTHGQEKTKRFNNKDDAINHRKEMEQLHGYI